MTGRGRPRRAKSPETKRVKSPTRAEETKQGSLPRCSGRAKEEKQNGTTKEQKPKTRQQKKPDHNEKMPPVQSPQREKTTKHFTEEISKQKKTSSDSTKAPDKGTKAKTYARRAKSPEQFTEETLKIQQVLLKCTTVDPVKTTKAKTCGGKAKSTEQFTHKTQPEIPKASAQVTTAKTCAGRKSPEKSPEETTKHRKSLKSTRGACEPQDKSKNIAGVDTILYTTLEKLKIKKYERSDASKVVNNIIGNIKEHMKKNSQSFKEVQEPLRTGSYYENLKIANPDEFDVMLPIPVDRVNIEPFGDDGAFYSVALKRCKSPLTKFQQETSILSANEMLREFREEVTKCVKTFKEWEMTRKKKGCPAVTLTTVVNSVTISLDVVLCLMVKSSWPAFTKDGFKIEGWLGTKMRQQYKYQPFYLVPKYEGKGNAESDGVLAKDVWRVSFSHIEKAILKNHGSEKTCCEEAGVRCCRKDCLKLLKHLLSLLKEKGSFDKFCSYHAKTTLLHACCSRTRDTDWPASSLSHCFQLLLQDFEDHLDKGVLHNFFIPTQNLLSGLNQEKCRSLAKCIKDQRSNGFPIFK